MPDENVLLPGVALSMNTRFFETESESGKIMQASTIYLNFANDVEEEHEDDNLEFLTEINQIYDLVGRIPPVIHGHRFTGMFNNDDITEVNLVNMVIESVLFEENNYFAGIRLKNIDTGNYETLSPMDESRLHPKHNLQKWLQANDHTRLVGFRTTKRCHSDM